MQAGCAVQAGQGVQASREVLADSYHVRRWLLEAPGRGEEDGEHGHAPAESRWTVQEDNSNTHIKTQGLSLLWCQGPPHQKQA